MTLTRPDLKDAARRNPAGLRRLALSLGLRIGGMSDRQVARLVWWRLSRDLAWRRRRLQGL